jgi:hypothetical protein
VFFRFAEWTDNLCQLRFHAAWERPSAALALSYNCLFLKVIDGGMNGALLL